MKLLFTILFFLSITSKIYAIDTKATEAIVYDYNSQEILFEKNADIKTYPASMTKILTTYIVFDRIKNTNLSLSDKCSVSPKAYRMGGSRMFLEVSSKVTINDLLKGIIVQSGNDASVTIAECLSGTEEDFAKLMNFYSNKMGLKNSNFINSSGWPSDKHYSTVRDILILSNSIIRDFPNLYNFFKENEFTYNGIKQPNRNKLIDDVYGTDGLKTGFTKKSGWGISTSTLRNGRRINVVINGTNSSRSRLLETEKLINWAYRETELKKILLKDQIIKKVDVWLGSKPSVNLIIKNDFLTTVSFEQLKTINSTIEYSKPVSAPFKKHQELGKMIIKISGKPDIEIPLVADKTVNKINPIFRVFAAIKYLIFGNLLDE